MSRYIEIEKALNTLVDCVAGIIPIALAKHIIEHNSIADVVEVTSKKYDCVSREQVRDLLHEYMNTEDFTLGHLDDCICEIPSLDVQPVVRGEWVEDGAVMKCSVCGNSSDHCGTENFCNYCGADMRGGWNEQIHLHYG